MKNSSKENGNVIAEFVLLIPLILAVFLGIVFLVSSLYARSIVYEAAHEAARAGAFSGGSTRIAYERASNILASSYGDSAGSEIRVDVVGESGSRSMYVHIHAPSPLACPICSTESFVEAEAYARIE